MIKQFCLLYEFCENKRTHIIFNTGCYKYLTSSVIIPIQRMTEKKNRYCVKRFFIDTPIINNR